MASFEREGDYAAFERVLVRGSTDPLPILAYGLMPTLAPECGARSGSVSRFMGW